MQPDVYRLLSRDDVLNPESLARPWVRTFLSQVAVLPSVPMEYSLKWSGSAVSTQRPTMGFEYRALEHWNWCVERLRHFEFGGSDVEIRQRLAACSLENMTMFIYGIEVGPDHASSRVKLHFDISGPADAHSKAREALLSWLVQQEGLPADMMQYGLQGRLLLGLDVMGDGDIAMRAYVSYDDPAAHKRRWHEMFDGPLAQTLTSSTAVAFAWKGRTTGTQMYVLSPRGLQEKLTQAGISGLGRIDDRETTAPAYIIGADLNAWSAQRLDSFTSYHMLPPRNPQPGQWA